MVTLLEYFRSRVNSHGRLRATLVGWEPEFYIQARDVDNMFRIHFECGYVGQVLAVSTNPSDEALLLRADQAVLRKIFSGKMSPLSAYTDGLLEVYGNQKDQIKLDVIALVVWGV